MSLKNFTTAEKLAAVEAMIVTLRNDERTADACEKLDLLRSIAADLRGRLDGAPNVALAEITRRLAAVQRKKGRLGYETGTMVGLAEELICRWPTLKQALERFGAEVEAGL